MGVESATRYQLPISFSWPISMVNLKRCLLETRIPIQGSDKMCLKCEQKSLQPKIYMLKS